MNSVSCYHDTKVKMSFSVSLYAKAKFLGSEIIDTR